MKIWIGTSGFQYKEWKGGFYPEDLPVAKMLPYYAERFDSTESNYSFRRIPSAAVIQKWTAATPAEFRFSFKAPQKVTHFARLKDCADTMEFFARVLEQAGGKAGPVLFQLPPNFQKNAETLSAFLRAMPATIRAAFEFRHPSWFDQEVYAVLSKGGAALCIAEDEKLAAPRKPTTEFGYLRLRLEDYTAKQIDEWVRFVQEQSTVWKEVFIYFKHEETGVGPKFGVQMQKALGLR